MRPQEAMGAGNEQFVRPGAAPAGEAGMASPFPPFLQLLTGAGHAGAVPGVTVFQGGLDLTELLEQMNVLPHQGINEDEIQRRTGTMTYQEQAPQQGASAKATSEAQDGEDRKCVIC